MTNLYKDPVRVIQKSLRVGLAPFVIKHYRLRYKTNFLQMMEKRTADNKKWKRISSESDARNELEFADWDLLIRLAWKDVFGNMLNTSVRNDLEALRKIRNQWAHETEAKPFDVISVLRFTNLAEKVLKAVGARNEAEKMKVEVEILLRRSFGKASADIAKMSAEIEWLKAEIHNKEAPKPAVTASEILTLKRTVRNLQVELDHRETVKADNSAVEMAKMAAEIERLKAEIRNKEAPKPAATASEIANLKKTVKSLQAELKRSRIRQTDGLSEEMTNMVAEIERLRTALRQNASNDANNSANTVEKMTNMMAEIKRLQAALHQNASKDADNSANTAEEIHRLTMDIANMGALIEELRGKLDDEEGSENESQQVPAAKPENGATFSRYEKLRAIKDEIAKLTELPPHEYRPSNGKYSVIGQGNLQSDIMFVSEATRNSEEQGGHLFCVKSGKVLDEMLATIGLKRKNVYITIAFKVNPTNTWGSQKSEQDPNELFLQQEIDIVQPKIIVTIGSNSRNFIQRLFAAAQPHRASTLKQGNITRVNVSYGRLGILPMRHPWLAVDNLEERSRMKSLFQSLKQYFSSSSPSSVASAFPNVVDIPF